MKTFKKAAPSQLEVMRVLEESPLPWTGGMLKEWVGHGPGGGHMLTDMLAAGRICKIDGLYTACRNKPTCSEPEDDLPAPSTTRATFSPRGPLDVITDDMLAKYGFNL